MIVDSDVGTDPDDTVVAIMLARHATQLGAALLVSDHVRIRARVTELLGL
jgi:hypothetical protein